jgi:hypothetical protein
LALAAHVYGGDTLPFIEQYQSPGDFGNLTFIYGPTNDTVFDGSIIWMGKGVMRLPASFNAPSTFTKLSSRLARPDSSRFQRIFSMSRWVNDTLPWTTIADLRIVRNYLMANRKIGSFLYTPSVGVGDPADWDWMIFFLK